MSDSQTRLLKICMFVLAFSQLIQCIIVYKLLRSQKELTNRPIKPVFITRPVISKHHIDKPKPIPTTPKISGPSTQYDITCRVVFHDEQNNEYIKKQFAQIHTLIKMNKDVKEFKLINVKPLPTDDAND